jgi:5-formyltetrahydrofolate cyclo-ligase
MHSSEEHRKIRRRIWDDLTEVSIPDSRFHKNFLEFIPDFFGSDICALQLAGRPEFQQATMIMVTPDNGLRSTREEVLRSDHPLLLPTCRLGRGFMILEGVDVLEGQECLASTLDGAEFFGRPARKSDIDQFAPLTLLAAGASGVTTQGVRVQEGPNYFDLEWAILRHLGLVGEGTTVAVCVHDCQVVEDRLPPESWEVVADLVVTPTRVLEVEAAFKKPAGISAGVFPPGIVGTVLESLR